MARNPNYWLILSVFGGVVFVAAVIVTAVVRQPLTYYLGPAFAVSGLTIVFIGFSCRSSEIKKRMANGGLAYQVSNKRNKRHSQVLVWSREQQENSGEKPTSYSTPYVPPYPESGQEPHNGSSSSATAPTVSGAPTVFIGGAPVMKSDDASSMSVSSSSDSTKKKSKDKTPKVDAAATSSSEESSDDSPKKKRSSLSSSPPPESSSPVSQPPTVIVASAPPAEPQIQPESTEGMCVICTEAESVMVMVPCGHKAVCESCAREHGTKLTSCPVCRRAVVSIVKVYNV